MRYYTHPTTNITTVSNKDGSTVRKNWVYFRSTLLLEAPSTAWRTILSNSRNKPSDKFLSTKSLKPSSKKNS